MHHKTIDEMQRKIIDKLSDLNDLDKELDKNSKVNIIFAVCKTIFINQQLTSTIIVLIIFMTIARFNRVLVQVV